MKFLPKVFVIGRQNVGKSTLCNAILKQNKSITEDTPGVTRDVIQSDVLVGSSKFALCDTPGLDMPQSELSSKIREVALSLLPQASVILHLLDAHDLRDYDHFLVELLRKEEALRDIPTLTLVNKVDKESEEAELEPFYRLGLQEIIPISAKLKRNLGRVFEKLDQYLPKKGSLNREISGKICILGKPNSGKSSLLNSFLGYERAVVSSEAGTTRDSVSERFAFDGKWVEVVDTAGIRRQSKRDGLEYYSFTRTEKSLESSDIALLLVDATKGFGEYDKKIFGQVQAKGKPILVGISKWDLVKDKGSNSLRDMQKRMEERFPPLKEIPMVFFSSLERQRTHKLLETILELKSRSEKKITTRALNDWLTEWKGKTKVQKAGNRPPKVYYATQVNSNPFRFLFFVNDTALFPPNILAFYRKGIREVFGLDGLTIEIETRARKE